MSLLSSRLLRRVAVGLASGAIFAGTIGIGYWAGLTARTSRPIPKANGPSGLERPPSLEVEPGDIAGDPGGAVGPSTTAAPEVDAADPPGRSSDRQAGATPATARPRAGAS